MLVLFHEDIINLGSRLMMNHGTHLAASQSRLLRICRLKALIENIFCKWNWLGKLCKWIHRDLKPGTLKLFIEYITVVQFIQPHQSWIKIYSIMNRGSKKSTNTDTSKKLQITFGIVFEN